VYGRLLSCLEREEESVSTEFAEEDMGMRIGVSRQVSSTRRAGGRSTDEETRDEEGSVDFRVRYL